MRARLPGSSCFAIFVLAGCVLALEVMLTRVFSVVTYYHFTYLIIALALLGFGAAGTVLSISRRLRTPVLDSHILAECAWMFGLLVAVCFLLMTRVSADAMAAYTDHDLTQIAGMVALMALAAAPFFFAGLGIAYVISMSGDQINRVYFFDLLGAGFGALGALFAINHIGVPSSLFGLSVAACITAAVVAGRRERKALWRYQLTALAAAALGVVAFVNPNAIPVPFPASKGVDYRETEHRWHVVSRVDVTGPWKGYTDFGGKLSSTYREPEPPLTLRRVYQDGQAFTGIIELEGRDVQSMPIFRHYLQSCPYVIRPGPKTLVIGPGGGVDVAIALAHASRDVTAVEINPNTIEYVRDKYNTFAGGLYRRPEVSVICAEGRHFLTASDERYDVIQLSGVDTFSALSSGAYALSENYLYTKEAILDLLDHLTDDGVLSFSRWLFTPPRETLRLAVTGRVALEARGVTRPESNIVVIAGHRNGDAPWAETLIKLKPFTTNEMSQLRQWASELHFDIIYDPLVTYEPGGAYDELQRTPAFDPVLCAGEFSAALRSPDLSAYIDSYFYRITPALDDAPFFFNFYRPHSLWRPPEESYGGYGVTRLPLGLIVLTLSFVLIVLLGAALILVPLRGRWDRLRGTRGLGHVFVYFASIGIGFMAAEIALLQRLMVFLGGPTYSIAVTLFSILVFSGLGSRLGSRFAGAGNRYGAAAIFLLLIVLMGGMVAFVNIALPRLLGLSLPMRCVVAILALMPLGMLMGMPFPMGIRLCERLNPATIPWAWSVNAFATVLGSIAAIIVAMFGGLTLLMYAAASTYLLAMGAITFSPRS